MTHSGAAFSERFKTKYSIWHLRPRKHSVTGMINNTSSQFIEDIGPPALRGPGASVPDAHTMPGSLRSQPDVGTDHLMRPGRG